MKSMLMTVRMLACAVLVCAGGLSWAETATWTGSTGGAWETGSNWDLGAAPGPTTNVLFATSANCTVNVSTELPDFATMFNRGKSVTFALSDAAKMTSTGSVTNYYNTVSFNGGRYALGGELVVGKMKNWDGSTDQSSSTRAGFKNCHAEIAGRIFVTGYANNGIDLTNCYVKCGGYLDDGGTRNQSVIRANGCLDSTGDINFADGYPNDSYPYTFTVDGGMVTNAGALKISSDNSGNNMGLRLLNGASWIQPGETKIGGRNGSAYLQIAGNSIFSCAAVQVGSSGSSPNKIRLVVDGSTFSSSGTVTLGGTGTQNYDNSIVVAGGSSFTAAGLTVGSYSADNDCLTIAITNSSFKVTGGVGLPGNPATKTVDFFLTGTEAKPATAEFPGGLVMGSLYKGDMRTRTAATTVFIDNGRLISGQNVDGKTSGDTRLGANEIAGVYDMGTNRLVIAGKGGCFVARHRMMTAGNPIIEFRVPESGYVNEYGAGLHVNNGYLNSAKIIVDLSAVTTNGTYTLVKSKNTDLAVKDPSTYAVVAPKKDARYAFTVTKNSVSVTVKMKTGLLILVQ